MHSLIVALLCLTLFVDSAKACWWLRQHSSRARVCQPADCRPASAPSCRVVSEAIVFPTDGCPVDHAHCFCDEAAAEHVSLEQHGDQPHDQHLDQTLCHDGFEYATEHHVTERHDLEHHDLEQTVVEQHVIDRTTVAPADRADDSVVVHGPTIVGDATPQQLAGGADAKSVVAQPIPVAPGSPAVLPTPTVAEEPIPDLKPAIAPQSPVAPASNEQPSPEPQAKTEPPVTTAATAESKPAEPKPAEVDQPASPAPVNDLAGGPEVKPAMPEPREPNLFDLYGDDGDDAPAEEPPAERTVAEPTDEANDDGVTATDEQEMTETEEPADAAADESADEAPAPADEPANEAGGDEDDATEEAAPSPQAEPAQAEADPFAAVAVPDEPMRHWSNDTGTHQARGWLVEIRHDRVRILKVNGRHTTVSIESLSAADRDYVSAVGGRLAAEREGISPAPTATAGL